MFDTLLLHIRASFKGGTVVFVLGISAFILAGISLGNVDVSVDLILFGTAVCLVLTKTGEFALRTSRLTTIKAWLPTAFVVGFAVISVPMVALTLIFNVSALTAFWISAVSVLSCGCIPSREATARIPGEWVDAALVLGFGISIGLLAKIPVSSPMSLMETGVLPIWSDYFLHGVTIASLGSPFASGVDLELAGVGIGFYHYAPYIIPAAFQTVSGTTGLALATSLLLPLGLLIATLGSYAFAVQLGGRLSGLLAITAIICLPAYSVAIQSGWFDFYWLLFASPGTGYALGVSAVVCASTLAYVTQGDRRVLWFTMLLLFSLILIRVHFFMLLAPAIVALLFLHRYRANIRLLLGVVVAAVLIGMLTLHYSTYLHSLWMTYSHPREYLNIALEWSLYNEQPIKFMDYHLLTMPLQLLAVMAAILGIYLVLYPLSLWFSVRRFLFHATDALPPLLLLSFLGLMLFAPTASNGDFTEYKHRHFSLMYTIIAIYTTTYACALVSTYLDSFTLSRQWVYGFVMCVYASTVVLNWNSNPGRPNVKAMPWASKLDNQSITPGLLETSHYIKTHAKHGDVLATGLSSSTTTDVSNLNIKTVSLTGIPAFISRADLKTTGSQCVREIVNTRMSTLRELSSMTSWPEARKILQSNGIRWFIVTSEEKPQWDLPLEFAVFSSNGVAVYDSGYSAGNIKIKPQC